MARLLIAAIIALTLGTWVYRQYIGSGSVATPDAAQDQIEAAEEKIDAATQQQRERAEDLNQQ